MGPFLLKGICSSSSFPFQPSNSGQRDFYLPIHIYTESGFGLVFISLALAGLNNYTLF